MPEQGVGGISVTFTADATQLQAELGRLEARLKTFNTAHGQQKIRLQAQVDAPGGRHLLDVRREISRAFTARGVAGQVSAKVNVLPPTSTELTRFAAATKRSIGDVHINVIGDFKWGQKPPTSITVPVQGGGRGGAGGGTAVAAPAGRTATIVQAPARGRAASQTAPARRAPAPSANVARAAAQVQPVTKRQFYRDWSDQQLLEDFMDPQGSQRDKADLREELRARGYQPPAAQTAGKPAAAGYASATEGIRPQTRARASAARPTYQLAPAPNKAVAAKISPQKVAERYIQWFNLATKDEIEDGLDWYDREMQGLMKTTSGTGWAKGQVQRIAASFSRNSLWAGNKVAVQKMASRWIGGARTTPGFQRQGNVAGVGMQASIEDALRAAHGDLSALDEHVKEDPFHRALGGDRSAKAIDRWMAVMQGYAGPGEATPVFQQGLDIANERLRAQRPELAARLAPRETQAVPWVAVRNRLTNVKKEDRTTRPKTGVEPVPPELLSPIAGARGYTGGPTWQERMQARPLQLRRASGFARGVENYPVEQVDPRALLPFREIDRERVPRIGARNGFQRRFGEEQEQGPAYLDKLTAQLKREGIREPLELLYDKQGFAQLADGNHRLAAAIRLGLQTVPATARPVRYELTGNTGRAATPGATSVAGITGARGFTGAKAPWLDVPQSEQGGGRSLIGQVMDQLRPAGRPGVHIEREAGDQTRRPGALYSVARNREGEALGALWMSLKDNGRGVRDVMPYVEPQARRQGIGRSLYSHAARAGFDVETPSALNAALNNQTPQGRGLWEARQREAGRDPAKVRAETVANYYGSGMRPPQIMVGRSGNVGARGFTGGEDPYTSWKRREQRESMRQANDARRSYRDMSAAGRDTYPTDRPTEEEAAARAERLREALGRPTGTGQPAARGYASLPDPYATPYGQDLRARAEGTFADLTSRYGIQGADLRLLKFRGGEEAKLRHGRMAGNAGAFVGSPALGRVSVGGAVFDPRNAKATQFFAQQRLALAREGRGRLATPDRANVGLESIEGLVRHEVGHLLRERLEDLGKAGIPELRDRTLSVSQKALNNPPSVRATEDRTGHEAFAEAFAAVEGGGTDEWGLRDLLGQGQQIGFRPYPRAMQARGRRAPVLGQTQLPFPPSAPTAARAFTGELEGNVGPLTGTPYPPTHAAVYGEGGYASTAASRFAVRDRALEASVPRELLTRQMYARASEPGGGFTADPRSGKFLEPKPGRKHGPYLAATGSSLSLPPGAPEEDFRNALEQMRARPENQRELEAGAMVGGWHDPKRGGIDLDVSRTFSSRRKLQDYLATRPDQLAGYDLAAGEDVYPRSAVRAARVAQQLRAPAGTPGQLGGRFATPEQLAAVGAPLTNVPVGVRSPTPIIGRELGTQQLPTDIEVPTFLRERAAVAAMGRITPEPVGAATAAEPGRLEGDAEIRALIAGNPKIAAQLIKLGEDLPDDIVAALGGGGGGGRGGGRRAAAAPPPPPDEGEGLPGQLGMPEDIAGEARKLAAQTRLSVAQARGAGQVRAVGTTTASLIANLFGGRAEREVAARDMAALGSEADSLGKKAQKAQVSMASAAASYNKARETGAPAAEQRGLLRAYENVSEEWQGYRARLAEVQAEHDRMAKSTGRLKGAVVGMTSAIGGTIIGLGIFSVASAAVSQSIEGVGSVLSDPVNSLLDYRKSADRAVESLGQLTRQQHGMANLAVASTFAQSGLGSALSDQIRPILEQRAAIQAGNQAVGEQIELVKAATGAELQLQKARRGEAYGPLIMPGAIPGITGTTGGFAGSPIGGQAPFFEQLLQNAGPSGSVGERVTAGAAGFTGGGLIGAAGGALAGAAIGSVVPGPGTVIGGLIGAGAGFVGGSNALGPGLSEEARLNMGILPEGMSVAGFRGLSPEQLSGEQAMFGAGTPGESLFGNGEGVQGGLGLTDKQIERINLRIDVFNAALSSMDEAAQRATPGIEKLAVATSGLDPNSAAVESTVAALAKMGASLDQQEAARVAGFAVVRPGTQEAVSPADLEKWAKSAVRGAGIPTPKEFLAELREKVIPAREFQLQATGRLERAQIEPQYAIQRLAQPRLTPGATVSGGLGALRGNQLSAGGITASSIGGSLNALDTSLLADVQQGKEDAIDLVRILGRPADTKIFSGMLDQLEAAGNRMRQLQEFSVGVQNQVQTAQYNEQIFQLRRSQTDLLQLTGQLGQTNGDNLGLLQRQLITYQRQGAQLQLNNAQLGQESAELGLQNDLLGMQAQRLSIMLSQRQINFQRSLAGFATPGQTPQEIAGRAREAELEADFAQKQLDIRKEQFALQRQQISIGERQIEQNQKIIDLQARAQPLGFQIEDIGFERQLRDVTAAIANTELARAASQAVAAAGEEMNAIQDHINKLQARVQSYLTEATAKASGAIGDYAQAIATLGPKAAGLFGAISAGYGAAFKSYMADVTAGILASYNQITGAGGGGSDTMTAPKGSRYYGKDLGPANAAGYLGTVSGATRMTVGEAGPETVAILRNPRSFTAPAPGAWGGGGGGVTVIVTGNQISGDEQDLEKLAAIVARKVEETMSRRGSLLGLRSV